MSIEFIELDEKFYVKFNNKIIEEYKRYYKKDKSYFWINSRNTETYKLSTPPPQLNLKYKDLPSWYELFINDEEYDASVSISRNENEISYFIPLEWKVWQTGFSIKQFINHFNSKQHNYENINIYIDGDDVDGYVRADYTDLSIDEKLPKIIDYLVSTLKSEFKDTYRYLSHKVSSSSENEIIKAISFKPEHQLAGISILQNFGNLLNEKYPEGGMSFSIKQKGLVVSMVIEHPEGEKEIVEDYLNRYGLVVSGHITPEQFSSDPIQVMDLKRQLIHLESELKWNSEKQLMLTNTITAQDNEILRLEGQLEYFQNQFKSALQNNHTNLTDVLEFLKQNDKKTHNLIKPLIKAINNQQVDKVKQEMYSIENYDKPLADKIKELAMNTMASSGANAPAWIDYLSRVLP